MNSISIIEFLLVGAIVVIQTYLAYRTFRQIGVLRDIIPTLKFFKLKKYYIPIEDLQSFQPSEILQNLTSYENKRTYKPQAINTIDEEGISNPIYQPEVEFENQNEVSLINPNELTNPIFDEILLAINVYLLRNKGAAADFNLIKDVVERNLDMEEEDISHSVTVPLYLGLMGTMVGIVFGLINLFLVSNTQMQDKLNEKIRAAYETDNIISPKENDEIKSFVLTNKNSFDDFFFSTGVISNTKLNAYIQEVETQDDDSFLKAFLGGVSIAMFASFWGLFCTVINSNFNLKNSKRSLEKAKNLFYTFLQTELLPVLNQSVSSSIYTLHTNLVKFNDNFTVNLNQLSGMLNKNHDALIAQERILTALDNIDIADFAKANVKVLKELKTGTEQLVKFSEYLNSLNFLSAKTSRLATSFEEILNRSNNFEGLAEKLDSRIEESNNLIIFLNDHFKHLQDRGEIIRDSVVKVEDVMIKSLNQLEEHTQVKISAIKEFTTKEGDLLVKAFQESGSHFAKLSLLEDLKKSIEDFKRTSNDNIGGIKREVESLKGTIEKSNSVLKEINDNSLIHKTQNVAKSIKQLFSTKK